MAARSLWLENHPLRSGLEDPSSIQQRRTEPRLTVPPNR
jgi:hypothetical protein